MNSEVNTLKSSHPENSNQSISSREAQTYVIQHL